MRGSMLGKACRRLGEGVGRLEEGWGSGDEWKGRGASKDVRIPCKPPHLHVMEHLQGRDLPP